jgi:hypothetical protein
VDCGLAVLLCLTACGRLGFDPTDVEAGIDAATADVTGDVAADSTASGLVMMQSTAAMAGNGTQTVMLPNPTSNDTVLVATLGLNNITTLTLPTGWVMNANSTVNGACVSVLATEASGVAGRQSFTFTISLSGPITIQVSEWTGVDLANPFDASGMGGGMTSTTALTIATDAATTTSGELAVAAFCQDVAAPTFTHGAGWTELGQVAGASSTPSLFTEYQSDVPTGLVTATAMSSASAKYAATVLTFRPK